jgi:DNA topoisomerase-1
MSLDVRADNVIDPRRLAEKGDVLQPEVAAESVGLNYVTDEAAGITRKPRRGGFNYYDPKGKRVEEGDTLGRIRKLAIPPAYTKVWICPDPEGHIQATGRDAKGRKQYRYHERFRAIRDSTKYDHMLEFAAALPMIRSKIDEDMKLPGLPREKVLATIVHLLETTMIRVGNIDYVKQNKSYGLTTLRDRHVEVEGAELRFSFKGKSGKEWKLRVKNRRVARIVKAAQDLPGQHLFQYLDDQGERREVSSTDVNAYLKAISGRNITTKDFRTWTGTVLAALALAEFEAVDSEAAAKKNVRAAIEAVAGRLGNTPTVCRKCYINPEIFNSYFDNSLMLQAKAEAEEELSHVGSLKPEEAAVLAFLHSRLSKETATN